jgi:uncharacterized protein (DUF433 family)
MTIDCRNIITLEPAEHGGKPCIGGLIITVYDVLAWLADGMTEAEILEDYPELEEATIRACLAFGLNREHSLSVIIE